MKTKYVAQLDLDTQKEIKNDLVSFYKEELNLSDEEIQQELELALSSRLIDLEETIDVNKIIRNISAR